MEGRTDRSVPCVESDRSSPIPNSDGKVCP